MKIRRFACSAFSLCVLMTSTLFANAANIPEDNRISEYAGETIPVSYTHLDVYKRQAGTTVRQDGIPPLRENERGRRPARPNSGGTAETIRPEPPWGSGFFCSLDPGKGGCL